MSEKWLTGLITADAQEGYELAIKLARVGVQYTQPADDIRDRLREDYEKNASDLIAASQVIAINFQPIAAANNYWHS